jgi:hypothetical protein
MMEPAQRSMFPTTKSRSFKVSASTTLIASSWRQESGWSSYRPAFFSTRFPHLSACPEPPMPWRGSGWRWMLLDSEAFAARLRGFARSAWRLETQPFYTMPSEQAVITTFLAGGTKPEGYNSTWHATVRDIVASGRSIGRVRTIRRPMTDYQRCQLAWVVPENVVAGEEVRILDLTDDDLGLPAQDYWLFDDVMVVELNFRPDGTLLSIDQREAAESGRYLKWRDIAVSHSVPFGEWNARTG